MKRFIIELQIPITRRKTINYLRAIDGQILWATRSISEIIEILAEWTGEGDQVEFRTQTGAIVVMGGIRHTEQSVVISYSNPTNRESANHE